MSHESGTIIINSLLEIFDPTKPEYAGVREHFSVEELERIDVIREYPVTHDFTLLEKVFVMAMIDKAIITAD